VIAVDTNVLVHAHRGESPWHAAATRALEQVSVSRWAIPWPCVHEFMAIATHPRVFQPPSAIDDALLAVESWLAVPTLALLGETESHWSTLAGAVREGAITGPRMHDARIAALCMQHAVTELWTADRDFSRFPRLKTRNPLVAAR
jgi:toxin-antitoxin system PIN domain toxin